MKRLYLLLTVIGFTLPLIPFILWLNTHGLDLPLLFQSILNDRLSLFAWLDVIISALALIAFILYEGKRLQMPKLWMPIAGTLCIGVSFGLPLFLLLREIHRESAPDSNL